MVQRRRMSILFPALMSILIVERNDYGTDGWWRLIEMLKANNLLFCRLPRCKNLKLSPLLCTLYDGFLCFHQCPRFHGLCFLHFSSGEHNSFSKAAIKRSAFRCGDFCAIFATLIIISRISCFADFT